MIEKLRAALEAATNALHERKKELDEAHQRIESAKSDDTSVNVDELRTAFDDAGAAFDEAQAEVERCKGNLADAERREKAISDNPVVARVVNAPDVRDISEPAVYGQHSERSFFADAYAHRYNGDSAARERLERHGRENVDAIKRDAREKGVQFRDVATSAFAGLTVPQYLIDLYAPLARAGAPALSTVRKVPLPEKGMTVNISRITTGAAVAAQSSETAAVQETDIDDTLLTINVRTYAGQNDVSRAALERAELVDAVVFQDLIADYFTKLDDAILNADGTGGTHLGIRSTSSIIAVTYTDASPTVPELYPKVADAIQQIASNRYAPATTVFMHPRRWGWGTAALDSSNRPLFVPSANGPFNALAVGDAPEYGAVVGLLQGLPVITDANLPTTAGAGTEDVIIISRVPDLLFWQNGDGSPRQFRFEETAGAPQLVRLAVFDYSAFTAGRYPKASATIGGTGLIAPTF